MRYSQQLASLCHMATCVYIAGGDGGDGDEDDEDDTNKT